MAGVIEAGERAPLLGGRVKFGERRYTSSESEDPAEWRDGERGGEAELGGYTSSASRTLPNNAPQPFVYLGFMCAVLAGLCFTSSNVMVKYIPTVNSWQLLFLRCLAQLLTMLPVILAGGHSTLGTPDFATRWRIAAQGVLGGLLLLAIFEAVARLPLGDCTAIFFSAPAFTMVLSCCLLRDHCGVWRCLVAAVLLSGVLILSRPPALFPSPGPAEANAGRYELIGILSALAVPVLSAWIVIITRSVSTIRDIILAVLHHSAETVLYFMNHVVVSSLFCFLRVSSAGNDDLPMV